MKTDTSMNLMLVVFCVILIGFVMLNSKMSDALNKKQAEVEYGNNHTGEETNR